jgi:hypothetical protein
MKLKDVKVARIPKPFYKDKKVAITTIEHNNRITKFVVEHKDKSIEFVVTKNNILAAWQKMEKYLLTV